MENQFPDFAHDAAEHWQYTGKKHSFVEFDKAFTDPFYQLTAKDKKRISDAAAYLQTWLSQIGVTKDDDATATPIPPTDTGVKPPIKKDDKKSNVWNVVGIGIAVVGVGLIAWGVVSYIKNKKAAGVAPAV